MKSNSRWQWFFLGRGSSIRTLAGKGAKNVFGFGGGGILLSER